MTADRDVLWADLVQFDPSRADRVWDGDLVDPDAPGWYRHLGDLIHEARGPAEGDELVDEPVVVDTMRRAGAGAVIRALPRRRGVRTVGRMVAMKATAAATAAGMVGVAAAATTGIVAATVVVVPAINERVLPVVHHVLPAEVASGPSADHAGRAPRDDGGTTRHCPTDGAPCTVPGGPVVVESPATGPADPGTPPPASAATDATAPSATEPAGVVEAAPVQAVSSQPAAAPVEAVPTTDSPTTTVVTVPSRADAPPTTTGPPPRHQPGDAATTPPAPDAPVTPAAPSAPQEDAAGAGPAGHDGGAPRTGPPAPRSVPERVPLGTSGR